MNIDRLASCAEMTTEHAEEAGRSVVAMRTLLNWAARVARPSEGAPKVLMAIARLARAEWVEGMPYIEIRGDDSVTKISIFADHGMGIRERVLPLTQLYVPVDEFMRAVRLAPQLVAPFRAVQRGEALILTPREITEVDCETISIDDSSLHEQERKTAPPPGVVSKSSNPPPAAPPLTATTPPPSVPDQSGIHTHPTVRRMVAVVPEALRGRGTRSDDD